MFRMVNCFRILLLHLFYNICTVNSEIVLPKEANYTNIYRCVTNITRTYGEKRTITFLTEDIEESDFMNSLVKTVDGPKKILSQKKLGKGKGFFIFLANKNKFFSKILEGFSVLDNSKFLLIWVDVDTSILHLRSIFQEFWSNEVLDVIALVQLKYGGLSVYTYFPYTKTQCADSGAPVIIDTWSPNSTRFVRQVNLFGRKSKVYSLHGCPLKCAGAHRPPDSIIEETGNKTYNLSGIGGLLFETIATKMNFTPVIFKVVDITSSYEAIFSNESSVLSIDVGTKKVDLGFGIFTRLLDYHPNVAFVTETNMDCFTWAVPLNAGADPSMWNTYVGEFSGVTWILICISLCFAVFIFYFLTYLTLNEDPHFKNLTFLSFFVYFTLLGTSVSKKPYSNVVRIFFASWLLYCLVVAAAYNGQLGGFATVPIKAGNIENTAALLKTEFSITGAPQMFYALNASVNTSQSIRKLLKRFEVLPPGNFLNVVEKLVLERNMAVFSTKGLLSYFNERLKAHNLPTSYLQPQCVMKSPSAPIIVRRVSPLREPLTVIIQRLFEAGILSRWERESKQKVREDGFQHEPKLYLEQMQGAFQLLISGLLLSVVVFVCELIAHRWIWPPPDIMNQLIADGYRIPFTK